MKKYAAVAVAMFIGLVTGSMALAGAIRTWGSGETLTASDLNATFSHIHNTMVGGHGARLVNADVSASAAISMSKLATPELLPKAWAYVASDCTVTPCTIAQATGVSAITRLATGVYTVTWSTPRSDAIYSVFITAVHATSGEATSCFAYSLSTTNTSFKCYLLTDADEQDGTEVIGVTGLDVGFNIMLWDNT